MMELLPRKAPQTWREFFLRVAAVAVAALVVLGAIALFESLRSSHAAYAPAPQSERSAPPLSATPTPEHSPDPPQLLQHDTPPRLALSPLATPGCIGCSPKPVKPPKAQKSA